MTKSKKLTKEDLEQNINELTEALQRERADVINVRRRHDEQIASLKNHVKADVVESLLPIIDNFERALGHVPKDLEDNDFVKGVQKIVKQFETTLSNIGVQRIKTTNEMFDPRYHEAVSVEEAGGDQEIVCEELQAGYKLGEKVLRHAMVRVKR